MTRVCLECGTPKVPLKERCIPCDKVTITHDGQARQELCLRCKFHFMDGEIPVCDWANKNVRSLRYNHQKSLGKVVHRINQEHDQLVSIKSIFSYSCSEFKPKYANDEPSPNPLSYQDREEIRTWHNNPRAFWLDPHRWDHVDNPEPTPAWFQGRVPSDQEIAAHHKQVFWDPPKPKLLDKWLKKIK